jgi:hypothetical protein
VRLDAPPAWLGERSRTGWGVALARGFGVFALVVAIGLVIALAGLSSVDSGLSLGSVLRLGALYLGPFHHVALRFDGDLNVDLSRLPGSNVPSGASATLQLGLALLAVTGLAMGLLFRAGRASAFGDGVAVRALTGGRVALGYAPPVVLIGLLVAFERPVRIGSFVTAGLRLSMTSWQVLVFPAAIAAVAGATGGLWSWTSSSHRISAYRVGAVLRGGWWMFLVGLGLAYAGLLVAGVVQPDEPVALATPSTARYYATVFDRPGLGAVILGHHVLLVPNQALWTLVPASGACDVVRGSARADLLCYGSFPSVTGRGIEFGSAPAGYLLFLLVPAVAAISGGHRAALNSDVEGWALAGTGAAAGVVYGVLVGFGCLLASITLTYTAIGASAAAGRLWIGPDPIWGTILALAWGVAGGAIGGASVGLRSSSAAPRSG